METASWLYFKVYVGTEVGGLDHLITATLPRVLEAARYERWFYLRYGDEAGIHLRARLLTPPDADQADALRAIWEAGLAELPNRPPSNYQPMVTAGFGKPPAGGGPYRMFVATDTYEPEIDKFGGPAAMPIAEEAFQASSEIAVDVLRQEGAEFSRKTIAPHLMNAVLRAFPPTSSKEDAWQRYSLFWLGGDSPAARNWRARFFVKAQELKRQGVSMVSPPAAEDSRTAELVQRWREALKACAKRYAREVKPDRAKLEIVGFHLTHLMNNRLGLTPLDEAYLAALLEHAEAAGRRGKE